MFKTIHEINWDNLTHAYGKASDISDLLNRATSDDAHIREQAWDDIHESLIPLDSSVAYETSSIIIPFVIEIFQNPYIQGRSDALFYLHTLTYFTRPLDQGNINHVQIDNTKDDFGDFVKINKEAYDQIKSYLNVYIKHITDKDRDVRKSIIKLLMILTEFEGRIIPLFLERLAVEEDSIVKAHIVYGLKILSKPASTRFYTLFSQMLNENNERAVKAMAAYNIVEMGNEVDNKQAVDFLMDVIRQYSNEIQLEIQMIGISSITQSLIKLGDKIKWDTMYALLEALRNSENLKDSYFLWQATEIFVATGHYLISPQKITIDNISKLQIYYFKQLVELDHVWQDPHLKWHLNRFGLPTTKQEITKFIARWN